ncbi:MAG TPA: hypothetical protein VM925_29805 [Labilithrix sp.]|jgi:hypothetical protein|nr:hypothetical protein [Labilithrix sp.]
MKVTKSSACVLLVALSTLACAYEDRPPRRLGADPAAYSPDRAPTDSTDEPETPTKAPTTPASPAQASPAPMLVEIDADQTMNAVGGEGVGVFVEYTRGGHWHVWWTCDTAQTKQSCDFSVSASVASGNVSNLDVTELEGGFAAMSTPSRIDAKSTTTTQLHGIRFDTNPGAVITVDAAIGSLKDGAFLFFVQDGKVNGGFSGKLTNPLQLQGNAP